MKNATLLLLLLLTPHIYTQEKQIPPAQKAELTEAEHSLSNPAFNLNFTVATSNSQDARAQNSTMACATQANIQSNTQPQIIIIKHEQESMAKGIFYTILSAGLHLGIAIFTGKTPTAATPSIIRLPGPLNRVPMGASPQLQRALEVFSKR